MGLLRAMRIGWDRLFLGILAKIFKFNRWHAAAPTSARPYRNTVAQIVNELRPNSVVEIGCGLGGVLSRIRAPERYGYDIDEGAIRAARFLHGRRIMFVHGDISAVSPKRFDVLILVNWIHELSPESLDSQLTPLLPRVRYLLLDAIDVANQNGYKYRHDFVFLGARATRLSITRPLNEGRSFHLFEVLP